jgi:hypothetical protein
MNKDTIGLLLQHLTAKDALELRRCNKKFNKLVSNCQLYWYYQHIGSPKKRVHVKKWSKHCIDNRNYTCTPNYNDIYCHLYEKNPEAIKAAFNEALMHQYNHGYGDLEAKAKRLVCLANVNRIDHKFCGRDDHFEEIHTDPIMGEITKDFTENIKSGLFMFKYLFACYHKTKKRLHALDKKSPDYIDVKLNMLFNTITLLESQVRATRMELAFYENYQELKEAVKKSVFHRKTEKNYHERKEVKKTF